MPSLSSVCFADKCDRSTSWMISAFSDAGYLMPDPPHPVHAFSAEYCRRADAGCPSALVLQAVYPARISASSSLLAGTMNQKSSIREVPQFVSQVLKANTLRV